MEPSEITVGYPEEWREFHNRHPQLREKLPLLLATTNRALKRDLDLPTPADRVAFILGHLSVEEFGEILLLAANGCGIGAIKLLRALFERVVTLAYIAKNPLEAERFLRYHDVHRGKHLNHVKRLLAGSASVSPAQMADVQAAYTAAREEFKEELCKKCGTSRTRFSWSKLDLPTMAREVGLENMYLLCSYEPTLQIHSTVSSLVARMKWTAAGTITFDSGPQREEADQATLLAHMLVLFVAKVIDEHFHLGMQAEIEERNGDFLLVWNLPKGCVG